MSYSENYKEKYLKYKNTNNKLFYHKSEHWDLNPEHLLPKQIRYQLRHAQIHYGANRI